MFSVYFQAHVVVEPLEDFSDGESHCDGPDDEALAKSTYPRPNRFSEHPQLREVVPSPVSQGGGNPLGPPRSRGSSFW